MPHRLPLKSVGAILAVASFLFVASPAHAGFQWVSPNESVPAPASGVSQPVISSTSFAPVTSSPEIISPVVITGNAGAPAAPVASAAAPSPAPAAAHAVDSASGGEIVHGFARSVPLPVALRQILPSGYAFSIDQNVDMGTLVSFQGGRSWRETLRDALDPVGLAQRENGQMVAIGYGAGPVAAATAPVKSVASTSMNYQPGTEPKAWPTAAASMTAAPAIVDNSLPLNNGESWSADRGESLRKVLEKWAQRSHVELNWLSEYDYPVEASMSFSGNFETAVRGLLLGFQNAQPQPVAQLHANPNLGQMVLVVQARGNTGAN